jgi:hypothetical protein
MFNPGIAVIWMIGRGDRAEPGVNQSTELDDLFERHRINGNSKSDRPGDHRGDDDQESHARHSMNPKNELPAFRTGAFFLHLRSKRRPFSLRCECIPIRSILLAMKLIALFLAPRSLVVLMRQNASNVKNDRSAYLNFEAVKW